MKYFLYPPYGLQISAIGLLEILISKKLDEEGLPRADPLWLTVRAFLMAVAAGSIPLAVIYGLIAKRMILHFLFLIATAFVIFSSFVVLRKPYLTYPSALAMVISIILAPFLGFVGFLIATCLWAVSSVAIYLAKLKLPEIWEPLIGIAEKAVDWKSCLVLLTVDVAIGFLRTHGFPV